MVNLVADDHAGRKRAGCARRILLGPLAAMLFSTVAFGQEQKPVKLADYASFCLALWANDPDLQAKADALDLQAGIGGQSITIGKSTLQFYKSSPPNRTVTAITTRFADGKDLSCAVNLRIAMTRPDVEAMEQTLHLDGQILTLGPAISARWKMPDRQPPVLLKVVVGNGTATVMVQQYQAAAEHHATQRH